MSKCVVAIDIDDVLVESSVAIVEDYNRRWGTSLPPSALYQTHDSEAWGADEATAVRRVDEFVLMPAFLSRRPTQAAVEALKELSQCCELHVLTGRSDMVAGATDKWLNQHFPDLFVSVNFSNMYNFAKTRTKGEICRDIRAEILIDDHVKHLESAAEYGVAGLLFGDYPWNAVDLVPDGITRCKDWAEVREYFDGRS